MKYTKTILFCLFAFQALGQDAYHITLNTQLQNNYGLPNLSQWILPNTETATLAAAFNYGSTVTTVVPNGQIFTQARSLTVSQGNNPWDAGHIIPISNGISIGDNCLLIIWLRSQTPNAKVNIYAENNTTYDKEVYASVDLFSDWKMYAIPFKSSAAYAIGKLNCGLHLALVSQTIEMGGMALLNYKNSVQLADLPVILNNDAYPGIDPNAPWRAEAAASIEQIRKANLNLTVLDLNGNPLPNAHVHLEMQQHEFKFGTAVISSFFGNGNSQNDTYEQKILNLDGAGHGFNEVVFENDLKWPAWEQHWYSSWPEIAASIQWLHNHDISIRGHNLVWPGWAYSPPDLEPNQGDPEYLQTRIRNHLKSILGYPGVGTEMVDWDVLNEISANNDYANALAGNPGFVTGRELYPQIFKQADSLAPNSKMYLNDYVAIEQGDASAGIDLWKSRLNELLAAGAPVEGIGFQGHFGASPTGIPRVKAIYDDFWSTYGLESKITEYDISNLVPPQTQAQYMRDILTISFAHPCMKGFLMWGFWDGAHWLSNAPIYNLDWSLKPSGEAFIDQIFHQWWTVIDTQTTVSGKLPLRGFKGKYRLRVACGTTIQEQDIVLDGDKDIAVSLSCLSRTRAEASEATFNIQIANQLLTASWETGETPRSLRIFNILGQSVASMIQPTGSQYTLNISDWNSGVYVIQCEINGQTISRKFVIRK